MIIHQTKAYIMVGCKDYVHAQMGRKGNEQRRIFRQIVRKTSRILDNFYFFQPCSEMGLQSKQVRFEFSEDKGEIQCTRRAHLNVITLVGEFSVNSKIGRIVILLWQGLFFIKSTHFFGQKYLYLCTDLGLGGHVSLCRL